jgi:endonuclease-3
MKMNSRLDTCQNRRSERTQPDLQSHIRKSTLLTVIEILESTYGAPQYTRRFDPMEELVSCILSQHTSDANSFPAFYRLRDKYPTWEGMAKAIQEEIAETIRAAGLANQKAKSILKCLQEIHKKRGEYNIDFLGEMKPIEARNWLSQLPGIGPKTTSIVLCFAFGMDVIPVDTHVYRVAWRLGIIPENTGEAKAHDLLQAKTPKGYSFRLHMDFIQHGRAVCKAPLPHCEQCSITEFCNWYKRKGPERRQKELRSRRSRGVSGRG